MKLKQKEKAITLRKRGFSLNEISHRLQVSKSSVSLWVREVFLSEAKLSNLQNRSYSSVAIERRRLSRLRNEKLKKDRLMQDAMKEIKTISFSDLRNIGTVLYWAEGRKASRNTVSVSNSDPRIIMIMMKFFREVCGVPNSKFRGQIHIHNKNLAEKAVRYWSGISKIPRNQFFKTYCKQSLASKKKRKTLPYGTLDIYIGDTKLLMRIFGWIHKIDTVINT